MSRIISIIFFAFFLASCANRAPYVPDEWVKCDGNQKPISVGEALGQIALLGGTFGILGEGPLGAKPYYRKKGEEGILACEKALSSGIFDKGRNWESHVNILKAKAIHNLEMKDGAAALIDLEELEIVAGEHADNVFYKRSLGLSVRFLQGLAYQLIGNEQAADRAFHDFSDVRPYSQNLQSLAWQHISSDQLKITNRLVHLDAKYLYLYAGLLEWEEGKEESAADNWAYLVEGGYDKTTRYQYSSDNSRSEHINGKGVADPDTLGRAAISAARVNRMAQAHNFIEKAKHGLVGDINKVEDKDDIIKRLRRNSSNSDENKVMQHEIVVNAYEQYYAGNIEGARRTLNIRSKNFNVSAPVMELIEKLRIGMPSEQETGIFLLDKKSVLSKVRRNISLLNKKKYGFLDSLFTRLPVLEKKSDVNSYSGKIWFFKSNGFSEEKLDDGTYLIKFTGDTSSPTVVEEMSLLRAADLAKKAAKEGFIILNLNNYIRTSYATYNGVQTGPGTHAGYMTSIKIALVDSNNIPDKWGIHKGRIFNSEKVWDDLSSIYVKSKTK